MVQASVQTHTSAEAIAARLVAARRAGQSLEAFPGDLPATLSEAYAIQEAAIALWPDTIVGWKIGVVPPVLRTVLGAERMAGPIFSCSLRKSASSDAAVRFPVFEGGFAAVEAELVFCMGEDAPPGRTDWKAAEALELVGSVHLGVETAGSPMPMINDIGPLAVVSDFGNNAGLVLGPEVSGWRERLDEVSARTEIEGRVVGEGSPNSLPGGPVAGLCYLLAHLASRDRPLRKGQLVSSGAITGVHGIRAGERARIVFDRDGEIRCHAAAFQSSD
jgi:2-keto-4-pentenoate hydratase